MGYWIRSYQHWSLAGALQRIRCVDSSFSRRNWIWELGFGNYYEYETSDEEDRLK